MTPIDFHPDAALEAKDAVDYYDGLRPGLGDDFRAELDAALGRLQQSPQFYAAESGSIRVCPLHRFPYAVYFELFVERIHILAVAHQHRRPYYWMERRAD